MEIKASEWLYKFSSCFWLLTFIFLEPPFNEFKKEDHHIYDDQIAYTNDDPTCQEIGNGSVDGIGRGVQVKGKCTGCRADHTHDRRFL